MRSTGGGPPALVLGYARLPEHRLAEAGQLLGALVRSAAGAIGAQEQCGRQEREPDL